MRFDLKYKMGISIWTICILVVYVRHQGADGSTETKDARSDKRVFLSIIPYHQ